MIIRQFGLLGISAVALCFSSQAFAQSAPTPAGSPENADATATPSPDSDQLGDIIVTATKRSESLQKVPLSITAVTGDALFNRGVQSFAELSRIVPGVVQTGSSQFSKITIRGIQTSSTTSSSGEQKAVAIYLDDLPLTSFSILTPEISPFDMNRIEVLRGPQGTLFGSGTLAGAVKYVTNKPQLNEFGAAFQGDVGLTGSDSVRRRASIMVNVPIVDGKFAIRAVAYGRDEDGYVTNITLNQKNADRAKAWGGRISARLQLTDRFTIDGMITYDRNKLEDSNRYTAALGTNIARSRIPYTTNSDVKTYNVSATYELPGVSIQSSTTFADVKTSWSLDLNAVTAYPYFLTEPNASKSFVEDFRIVSTGKNFVDFVVGAFYLNQRNNYRDIYWTTDAFVAGRGVTGLGTIEGTKNVLQYDVRFRRNFEAALYGELSLNLTDTLKVTAGLRETEFRYSDNLTGAGRDGLASFTAAIAPGANGVVTLTPQAPIYLTTGLRKKLTQKYNVSWQPTADKNFYVLVSEGFRRGHPNLFGLRNGGKSIIDPTDPTIIPVNANPDTLWNYEIGAKTRWLDGRLQLNVALYYIDWGPMQVNLVRQSDTQPFVGNAGKSTSKGIEIEIQARPFKSFDLGANITLQRARITSLTPQEALISGAVLGGRLASPEFQIYGYAQKSWDIGDKSSIFVRADVQHVGDYPNSFPLRAGSTQPNANYFIIPSYTNLNLSAGFNRGRLGVTLYGENVTNNLTPIFINASSSSSNRYVTLRPRTIGVRVDWKY